ncbi:hypothetical protein [Actinophytocola glycyrrhizae]|uniref:DUF998 domain-containing protein n=1 Tax=Actinophytocola glycyrrhizae TaxID=2044873 RepID=A0ABV9S819_9PSEU
MVADDHRRRWPALGLAALFLAYAAGKAVLAVQDRLGFPGGPPVSAAESESYFLDAATAQWSAVASGVLGAWLALATVTPLGRRVPRTALLVVLAGMLVSVAGGAGIMVLDGFLDVGIGWRWYHGVLGLLAIGLSVETTRAYAAATKPRAVMAGTWMIP